MNMEIALELLSSDGLEFVSVYDGPASLCPECDQKEHAVAA
jgi:hypothetical protein